MTDLLQCTYADLKTVKTRGVCQIVLEMPIEGMADAFALLGAPIPGNEVWVAVARLRSAGAAIEQAPANDRPQVKLAKIAGIICNEGGFWTFLRERTGHAVDDAESAAKVLRLACAVRSRADLDVDAKAAGIFRDLKAEYDLWLKDVA